MSGRDHAVEPVCSDKWPTERASRPHRGDLRIGQVADQRIRKAPTRESAQEGDAGNKRWGAVKPSRKYKQLCKSLISAAERRNIARQPQPELIVKDTEMPAHDSLRRHRPGNAQTRREIPLGDEFRVVVPTEAEVQSEIMPQFPIILHEQPVVIVPQMNRVSRGRQSSNR